MNIQGTLVALDVGFGVRDEGQSQWCNEGGSGCGEEETTIYPLASGDKLILRDGGIVRIGSTRGTVFMEGRIFSATVLNFALGEPVILER